MRIHVLKRADEDGNLEVVGQLSSQEYAELQGTLEDLRVFSIKRVSEPASSIKTGARHSYAKYLLFPVTLRRQWRTEQYDFEKLRCGVLPHEDILFVIYAVPAKSKPR